MAKTGQKITQKVPPSAHGFDWRRKKKQKVNKKSQTPGSQKTLSCQATSIDRFCTKRSRSYKHQVYKTWGPYYKAGNTRILIGE